MLNTDGDSSNGIVISDEVRLIAQNWQQVDFTTADLDTELMQIISDVATADSRVPVLPSAQEAKTHYFALFYE